jgi:nitrilase
MNPPIAAVIQMTSSHLLATNLEQAHHLLQLAAAQGARLVILPEMWATMTLQPLDKLDCAESFGDGPIQSFLQHQAKTLGLWIVGGTIPLKTTDPRKIRAACLVFNDQGECVARYDKIHLFDASVHPGREDYQESAITEPGDDIVALDTPIGKLGLAVCYDIRFPELFRSLVQLQVEVFAVPAAFTLTTGKAHWRILMRARAIENFCYVLGADQWGQHDTGRQTFGGSCIIEPWGEVLKELDSGIGVISAPIDLEALYELRTRMPVIQHRKLK